MPNDDIYYSPEGPSAEGPSSLSPAAFQSIERIKRELEQEAGKHIRMDAAFGPSGAEVGAAWTKANWSVGAWAKAPWGDPKSVDWGVRVTASW